MKRYIFLLIGLVAAMLPLTVLAHSAVPEQGATVQAAFSPTDPSSINDDDDDGEYDDDDDGEYDDDDDDGSPAPCGSFDAQGNTTAFGIPAGLSGNISRGEQLWGSFGQSFHGNMGSRNFQQIKNSMSIPEMQHLNFTDQDIADLTAYLNRNNLCSGNPMPTGTPPGDDMDDDDDDMDDDDDGDSVHEREAYAKIDSFPAELVGQWTIGGVSYAATVTTQFEQEDGPFATAVCVSVEFYQNGAGQNIATDISTESPYKCGANSVTNESYGPIEGMPATGFIGLWRIGQQEYNVTAATEFDQDEGAFAVGVCVKVSYYVQNGVHQATEIESESDSCRPGDDDHDGQNDELYAYHQNIIANIESLPADPYIGTWVIGGNSFEFTTVTMVEGPAHRALVGALQSCGTFDAQGNTSSFGIPAGISGNIARGEQLWNSFGQSFHGNMGARTFQQVKDSMSIPAMQHLSLTDQDLADLTAYLNRNNVCAATPMPNPTATPLPNPTATPLPNPTATPLPNPNPTATPLPNPNPSPSPSPSPNPGPSPTPDGPTEPVSFTVGDCVKAYYRMENGSNILTKVEQLPASRCERMMEGGLEFKSYGVVQSYPQTLTGAWQISGVSYQAMESTKFEQEYGFFEVGAFVEVKYRVENGANIAFSIETHVASDANRTPPRLGQLNQCPADYRGQWMINGDDNYWGDETIDVDTSVATFCQQNQSRMIATGFQVRVDSYPGVDGRNYIIAIAETQLTEIYLPIVIK